LPFWFREYTRLTAIALTWPVPGWIATSPSAKALLLVSFSSTFAWALRWIFGSSVVTILYPPRRSRSSRSCALLPNAFCSFHHVLK
jgi:hypothetical protein